MRTINDYGTFDDAVANASDHARELASQLRKLVIRVMPEVVEIPWPKMRMASYGEVATLDGRGLVGTMQQTVAVGDIHRTVAGSSRWE